MNKILIVGLLLSMFATHCTHKMNKNMSSTENNISKEWRKEAPKPGPAKLVQLGEFQSYDMANGLKVILVENHKRPLVSFQLALNHEQILEGDEVGYVSIAGDLISKGTTKRNKADLDKAIDFIGGNISTNSNGVFASGLKKHGDELMEIMSEMILEPSFPQDEFDKSKKQTLTGLTMALSNADAMISNVGDVLRYGKNHPYGEIQTPETTEKIKLSSCKKYFDTFFVPNNAYLIVVGDINLEETKALTAKYFSNWQAKTIPTISYASPMAPDQNKVAFVHKENAVQSVINITYPVDLKPGSTDVLKASVMNSILGGGIFSGRLMQNLREDKAYTYGARSQLRSNSLVGNFKAFANVRNEVTDSSVIAFLYEINRLVDEKVTVKDLELVKNSMAGGFARSLESPQTIARFARNTFKYNLSKDYYKNYLKNLSNVSVEDVSEMAMKYMKPDNCYIVVVGDKGSVAEKLVSFDGDNRIDYYDAFGKEIKEVVLKDSNITVEKVLNAYLDAIGGTSKLSNVNTMSQEWTLSMMGQPASMKMKWKGNSKYLFEMKMGENVLQAHKFNGHQLIMSSMGQSKTVTEGEEYDNVRDESKMFEQMFYLSNDMEKGIEIEGAEVIEGEECYKISIKQKTGDKTIEYYSISSGLLTRKVETEGPPNQQLNIVTDYKDYMLSEGLNLPNTMIITGAMPIPLVMKLKEIKVNETFKDDEFE